MTGELYQSRGKNNKCSTVHFLFLPRRALRTPSFKDFLRDLRELCGLIMSFIRLQNNKKVPNLLVSGLGYFIQSQAVAGSQNARVAAAV
jgi:hypothetical protein